MNEGGSKSVRAPRHQDDTSEKAYRDNTSIDVGEERAGVAVGEGFPEVAIAPATHASVRSLGENGYAQMLQGTPTNKLKSVSTRGLVADRNGNAAVEQEGFRVFFRNYSKLNGGLTVGANKMLDLGAILLKRTNNYRAKPGQRTNTSVSISLEDYGRERKYDVSPHETTTPEEAEAEKKRRSNTFCEIRKRANAELEALYNLSLSWREPGSKKQKDYADVRILQSKGIRNGYINMRFSEEIADYLTHAYITQYPTALFAVDERNPRTYKVGYALTLHHGMDNNRAKGTASIISVKSLLDACGDIPSLDEIESSRDRGHWERRTKAPLEAALENLVSSEVITSWEYCNSKDAPLREDQICISDYQTFTGLYVHFDMVGEPDQSERLLRKAERIAAAKGRAKAKEPRKKAESKEKSL